MTMASDSRETGDYRSYRTRNTSEGHRHRDDGSPKRRRSQSPIHHRENSWEESRAGRRHNKSHRRHSRSRETRSRSPRHDTASSRRNQSSKASLILEKASSRDIQAPVEKQRPNFGVSGKLAAETNTVQGTGIVLKYNEPSEARKPAPAQPWRLYVFKDKEVVDDLELHLRSCWLFGRERVVADYHLEHPSISKQHAVIQFRHIDRRNEFGDRIGAVKPYLIDLDSANGTHVNKKSIPPSRYYELRSGDVLSFGDSSREYVMMLPPKD